LAEIGFGDEKGVWSKMCSLQENRVLEEHRLVEKIGLAGDNCFLGEKLLWEENRFYRKRCAPP
jgi:hypothetical protein